MILTLTLSPVLDKSATLPKIFPGHKLRCSDVRQHAGGGGINVSRALRELGGRTVALFPSGGASGDALCAELRRAEVPFRAVPSQAATRESFSVCAEESNAQYRFIGPAVALERPVLEQLLLWDDFPGATFLVLSGSAPPGLPAGYLGRVVQQARRRGMRVLADSSGAALAELLDAGIYLLKPSLSELAALSGQPGLKPEGAEAAARELLARGRVQVLLVSLAAEGAFLVTPESALHIPAPPSQTRSTVGAGDSLVAGMAWMLDEGASLADAAAFGVACGSAATEGSGTDLFTRAAAWRHYAWVKGQLAAAMRRQEAPLS